jgi:hypothetical protein
VGLDIKTFISVGDLRETLDEHDDKLQVAEGLRILSEQFTDGPCEVIWTRPGSYSGLHIVRSQYAKLKGWPIGNDGRYICDGLAQKSHLINHCDAQWYYLPVDFPDPQWIDTGKGYAVSIGSSVRLLAELWELYAVRELWPVDFARRWDAVFLPALASVACGVPIEFK